MKYTVIIPKSLPSLNTYIDMNRRNKYQANNYKKGIQKDISIYIKREKIPKIKKPVIISIRYIEETRKRDIDNVFSANKFILDALVQTGVIQNDSQKYVVDLKNTFEYNKSKTGGRVILEIEEVM